MAKCPRCRKEVDYLKAYQGGEDYDHLYVDKEGYADYHRKEFLPDGNGSEYECPECSKVLFRDEEEAVEFLKGAAGAGAKGTSK